MPVVVQRQVLVGGSRQCSLAVLGQGLHARCCVWRRWPDSAENCGDSTGANGPDSAETVEDPKQSPQVQSFGKVVGVPGC